MACDSRSFHFVLVHGACFGGWCWYKIADLLKKEGHTVSPLDMAGQGIDSTDADQISTLEEYNQPLTDFFTALPSNHKVILVGHSAGGFNLSYTMEHFPLKIAAAVFVTAVMALSGTTAFDIWNEDICLTDSLLKRFPFWEGALSYTNENYGRVPRAYVVTKEDKIITEEFQRKMIADNPPQMVYEIEGSDHSPFFCKPHELARILVQIANGCLCN